MVNLRAIDLNLLTVFEAVYEERNQARAAERLALTQPAVSNAMGRLRHVVRDPLFVPGSRGVAPTPAADRLYPRVHAALEGVRTGLAAERGFDPRTTRQTFTVAAGYGGGAVIGPALYAWLAAEAPHARLVIRAIDDPALLGRRLFEGRLDAAWDYADPGDPDLHSLELMRLEPVVIVRRGHPRIRRAPTLAQLKRERSVMHVEAHPAGSLPDLDESLAPLVGDVAIEVPTALAIPVVVASTDLVGYVGTSVAAVLARPFDLRVYPFPVKTPRYTTRLLWHAARDADPAQRWLRGGIVEAARRVTAALPAGIAPAAARRRAR
jgi:DNA-binding transcriptional LysR family regulator